MCWRSITTHFKHHLEPKIIRIKSHACLCYPERANSTFSLENIAILEFGRNTGKTGAKLQSTRLDQSEHAIQPPMDQSKLSAPTWAHKRRASILVVGVIANKFHKVLVYICMQVAYAWKWERERMQPMSKVTRQRSEAISSWPIRHKHKDPLAHQSG